MHAIIFAAGELLATTAEELGIKGHQLVIAADGGLAHAAALGVPVDVLIGDFDSIASSQLQAALSAGQLEVVEYPADKNATDLELAIELAVARGATRVTVVAAFGGRLDHELATIGLLGSPQWKSVAVRATDGRRSLWIVRDEQALSLAEGRHLSLVPWAGDVTGVTTTGLQWPLEGETLPSGSTRGVSNIAIAPEQSVSIDSGVLLAIADALET